MEKGAMGRLPLGPRDCFGTIVQSREHVQPGPCRQDHAEERESRKTLVAAGWASVCSEFASDV